jgi:UDP-2,3-diacylglucosamine hydrolase
MDAPSTPGPSALGAGQARRETLFVSDLHLSPERPATVRLFLGFLAGRARGAAALYILGDLFDAWIGDDDDTPPYPEIRAALRALADSGTACRLMRGNRDFLLGRAFARDTGCRLLKDPSRIVLDGERVLLMHGDLLCTDDLPYQRFRRRVRNPLVTGLFLLKPLKRRRQVAADYRRRSAQATAEKESDIMDVNDGAVARWLRRGRASRLVHGHTHRPADHEHSVGDSTIRRLVLDQWHEDQGEVLVHTPGRWQREPVLPEGT